MGRSVEVPVSLLKRMARAAEAFSQFEDDLEDYLLSQDPKFLTRMREARAAIMAGRYCGSRARLDARLAANDQGET